MRGGVVWKNIVFGSMFLGVLGVSGAAGMWVSSSCMLSDSCDSCDSYSDIWKIAAELSMVFAMESE